MKGWIFLPVAGALSVGLMPVLPPLWLLVSLLVLALWQAKRLGGCRLAAVLAGVVLAVWQLMAQVEQQLSPDFDGRTLWLEGRVTGLPQWQQTPDGRPLVRFELDRLQSRRIGLPKKIRVSWQEPPPVQAGERWRLAVSLKRPYGLQNPHGFDYQRWLLARSVGATGSVRSGERLERGSGLGNWRERLRQRIQARLPDSPAAGAVQALALGDGSALSRAQWQLLQDSGTVHLFVISGQHVGLVAGFCYGLAALMVRLGLWPMSVPWLVPACVLAMTSALLYGLLAGFEVPVQRSLVMTALVLLWRMRHQSLASGTPWLWALALVLLPQPQVMLQPGFWLSFLAVAVLLLVFAGRLQRWRWWQVLWRAQWSVSLGLLPVLLASSLPVSKVGPLANLLAVPWVSLVILPLVLLGVLLLPWPALATPVFKAAVFMLDSLWRMLAWLVQGWPAWQGLEAGMTGLLLAGLAALLLLLPRALRPAWLVVLLFVPLWWPPAQVPLAAGRAQIWLLDVGQGQAIVIRTRHHALMYDAGPAMGGIDTGETIVMPFLRGERIDRLERLILSHADADHAGGAGAVLAGIEVNRLVSGEPERHPDMRPQPCHDEAWQLDGVHFQQWQWAAADSSNEASCVLLVEASGERFLVTGDLGLAGERAFLQAFPGLQVDWLVAGHHGSRSSTGWFWLEQLQPGTVLLSRGRYNSYGHPHPLVLERIRRRGAQLLDTAQEGAVRIELGARQSPWRQAQQRRFWRSSASR